jgi:hypothetical protein
MHESWEDNISEQEQWAKINIDRKRSSYIEKDCFEKSHNYCRTGDRTAELNNHLVILFPQELSDMSLTIPASTVGLQLLNLRLLKDGVTTIRPGHQTTGNARVMWSGKSYFTLFPTSGRVYV